MGTLLGFLISTASVVLQFIATLNVSPTTMWYVYQPRTPKSLLK